MTRSDVRARMVAGALRLLATRGLEGTSFAEVLALADAPRGSVYHHFPGGKVELVHAALDLASERALAAMEGTRGEEAAVVTDRFLGLWRILLDRSGLAAGCAVVAVTVASDTPDLLEHAGAIFRTWIDHLTDLYASGGWAIPESRAFATLVIAATEGAVLVSRAQHDRTAFDAVAAALLDQAQATSGK
jgi:TetR/AcrR family transcriptional regulator, lmrAB and yxaGH operons repressor